MDAKETVKEYYIRLDGGREDLLDLFTEDAQFYFPKFGISKGKSTFSDLISGLLTAVESLQHDIDGLQFIVEGNRVAVEGTTAGRLHDGTEWEGGKTPGGRFSSIFELRDGLISRMHVYLDPDYGSADTSRFLWPASTYRHY